MSGASLGPFFDAMRVFLDGEIHVEALVDRLGPSPSGAGRLALYPKLVRRQRRDILDGLFPGVSAACRLIGDGVWEDLSRSFVRRHPPRHWEPNHLGAPFAEFLAEQRRLDPALPPWLDELADYAWVRFAVAAAHVRGHDDGATLDRRLFVRRYEYDVVTFTAHVMDHPDDAPTGPPSATTRTVLVGWSHNTEGGVKVADASLAALVAIARRHGSDPLARRGAVGLTEQAIAAAERELVVWGLLTPA